MDTTSVMSATSCHRLTKLLFYVARGPESVQVLICFVAALQDSKLAFCYTEPPCKRLTGSNHSMAPGLLMTWCYRVYPCCPCPLLSGYIAKSGDVSLWSLNAIPDVHGQQSVCSLLVQMVVSPCAHPVILFSWPFHC